MYVVLGVDQTGKDSMGLIKINIVPKPQLKPNITETKNVSVISMVDKHVGVDYTKLTPEDIIEKATGYGEDPRKMEDTDTFYLGLNSRICGYTGHLRVLLYSMHKVSL